MWVERAEEQEGQDVGQELDGEIEEDGQWGDVVEEGEEEVVGRAVEEEERGKVPVCVDEEVSDESQRRRGRDGYSQSSPDAHATPISKTRQPTSKSTCHDSSTVRLTVASS